MRSDAQSATAEMLAVRGIIKLAPSRTLTLKWPDGSYECPNMANFEVSFRAQIPSGWANQAVICGNVKCISVSGHMLPIRPAYTTFEHPRHITSMQHMWVSCGHGVNQKHVPTYERTRDSAHLVTWHMVSATYVRDGRFYEKDWRFVTFGMLKFVTHLHAIYTIRHD